MDDDFVIAKTNEELVDILCKIEEKLSELKLIHKSKENAHRKAKAWLYFLAD